MSDPHATPSRRSSRLVILAAGLVVVVVGVVLLRTPVAIGLANLRCGSGDDHEPGGAPGPPPIGSFEPTAAAPHFAAAWADDVTLEDAPLGGVLHAVAAHGAMAVAVGRTEEGGGIWRPLIVQTLDGRRWTRSEVTGGSSVDGDVVGVVAGGPGWVAVGSVSTDDRGGSAGAIWSSEDGRTWTQASLQPVSFIHSIAVVGGELWAIGSPPDGTNSLGVSTDGLTWAWRDPGLGDSANVSVARAGDEWIAAGAIPLGGDELLPAVWRSRNGIAWSCTLLPTPPGLNYGSATQIVQGATTTLIAGFAAAGCSPFASCPASTASWVAGAAGTWVRVDGAPAGSWPIITADDGTFLTVNGDGVWHARDGSAWERVAQRPESGVPEAIVLTPHGLVGAGTSFGAGTRPWLGLLPAVHLVLSGRAAP